MKKVSKYLMLALIAFIAIACNKQDPIDLRLTPNDYLSDKHYDKLTVELLYVEGHAPNAQAVDNLEAFLNERLNKPKGIYFIERSIPATGNHSFSISDIEDVEKAERTQYRNKRNLAAFIFYTDAEYAGNEGDSKTLGVQYGPSSMALFEPTIDEYSGGLGQVSEEKLQSAVLIHEFCHVLGLVNNGTKMQQDHEDYNNPYHCDNEDCLMYYASNTGDMLGILIQGERPELDQQCIDDLRANGGK